RTLTYYPGLIARHLAATHTHVLALVAANMALHVEVPLDPNVHYPEVVETAQGVPAFVAPIDAYIINGLGLSDVIAARLRIGQRGRPGHEKQLSQAWMLGRFAPPNVTANGIALEDVIAARMALQCGGIPELLRRTEGPFDVTNVFSNIAAAPHLTSL